MLAALLARAANPSPNPGLPGATAVNQQIFINAPGNFNRVVITLVLADRERQRVAPAHARDLRQLRPCLTRTPSPLRQRSRGLTLVEIMVGVAIGLIGIVAMFQAVAVWSKHTRRRRSGGDAQVAGTLALFNIERDLKQAGHGFSGPRRVMGSPVAFDGHCAGPRLQFRA